MTSSTRNLPLNVIGGYLGSGKTTLINRLLAGKGARRVAVLVNDFGSLNIDAALIDSVTDRTIALTNGCICCLLGDDLGVALAEITAAAAELDHVLLEASGVANGVRLGAQIRAWPGFELRRTLTLVDVSRIRELVTDKYIGRHVLHQLQGADLLVLTRTDECSAIQLEEVCNWLQQHHEGLPPRHACDVQWAELLEAPGLPRSAVQSAETLVSPVQAAQHHPQLRSATYRQQLPVDRARFDAWLTQVSGRIQRAKGWIEFAEQPGVHYLLQMVGDRVQLTRDETPRSTSPALVVIAREIDALPDPFAD